MDTGEIREILAFAAVVENGNFTRAAGALRVTTSALSQTIKNLEERLGVRVLNRTTRSVSATHVGQRLYEHVKPALATLAEVVEVANDFRDRPRGALRITMPRFIGRVLGAICADFLRTYPDVQLELDSNDEFIDIVKAKLDAGVRLGEHVARDMTAVKLGGKQRLAAVASPSYLAEYGIPKIPSDLRKHRCINWRTSSSNRLYRWEFEKNGRELELAVEGPLVVTDAEVMRLAALGGAGIAYPLESMVVDDLRTGALQRVLTDWSPEFPGFYIYYPSRKHVPAPLKAFVEFAKNALR